MGGWYAIHVGRQFINDDRAARTRQAWPDAPAEDELPHSVIAGLFHIEEHRTPQECREGYMWARGPVCHIISKAIELPEPIWCRGDKGLWDVPENIRNRMRLQLLQRLPGEDENLC